MANVFVEESTMTSIGNAIRKKTGKGDFILPADMPNEIESITTGGGGGTSGGLVFPAEIITENGTSFGSDTISGYIKTRIPEDGILLGAYAYMRLKGVNNSGATVGSTTDSLYYSELNEEFTVQTTTRGVTTYRLKDFSHTISGAYSVSYTVQQSHCYYVQPNAYIKNNILYAGEGTKGLLAPFVYSLFGRVVPYNVEAIDLRGSLVKTLPPYVCHNNPQLKKIWFSEVFEYVETELLKGDNMGIEELHFTSTTPPALGYQPFSKLPTTCKIYVPAGSLETYTGTANYPSASKYTYIEE